MSTSHAGLRVVSLTLLALQNCALGLVIPQSRVPNEAGKRYDVATAVFVTELGKMVISLVVLFVKQVHSTRKDATRRAISSYRDNIDPTDTRDTAEHSPDCSSLSSLLRSSLWKVTEEIMSRDGVKMIVPAALYVVQNNLLLIAANHLSPTSFQVFSQFKIVTTAVFTVFFLQRRLTMEQWASILVLTLGVMIFQSSQGTSKTPTISSLVSPSDVTVGFSLMMVACVSSGFAGTATEKILKESKNSIWANNFQIAILSLIPASLPISYASYFSTTATSSTGTAISFHPLEAFNIWTWSVIVLNIVGGLLVSMVVKFADSILKAFAASVAVILTFAITFLFMGARFSLLSLLGATLVIVAVLAYNRKRGDEAQVGPYAPLSTTLPHDDITHDFSDNEMTEVITDAPQRDSRGSPQASSTINNITPESKR
jgi:UDP-sugar transporter A1/2/3